MNEKANIGATTPPISGQTADAHGGAETAPLTAAPPFSAWLEELAQPRIALPALAIFGVIIFIVNLGGYPLYTKGEPREAVTIFDIVNGGGIVLPMRAGVELPSKPLLMHWMAALVSILSGRVNEWTVRLPSALLAIAGILVCFGYLRRLFNGRAALIAALILGTAVQYLQAGLGARVDTTLTFFMEVAFFEFIMIAEGLTRRRYLMYGAIAMAVLSKGPVGLILPAAVAAVWIALERRWSLIRELRLVRGAIIVAILAGWWYAAASIIGGSAFIDKQLLAENFVRFFGARHFHEGHAHPFYYLELALFAGMLPWTPLFALFPAGAGLVPGGTGSAPGVTGFSLWSRGPRPPDEGDATRQSAARFRYLLVWVLIVLAFYSFAHSKRGVYLLALYPALCAILALALDAFRTKSGMLERVFSHAYGAGFILVAAGAFAGLAMLWLWPPALLSIFGWFGITNPDFVTALQAKAYGYLALSIAIPAATAAVGVLLLRTSASAHKLAIGIAAGMGLIALAANLVVVPAIADALSLKGFAADVAREIDNHPTAYLTALDYDAAFYLRRSFPIIPMRDTNKPEFLISWAKVAREMPAAERAQYQTVLTSHPTALNNTGRMVLMRKKAGAPEPAPSSNGFSV